MKFPVPKTLPGAFLPILLINWLFGIGVVEYPMGISRPVISALWSIANFLIYLGFLRMANLSELVTFQESKIAANSYRVHAYFCTAFIASSLCIAKINAKAIKGIFPKVSAMNDRLNVMGISNDYEWLLKYQIIQLAAAFSFTFILMGLDFKYVALDFPSESSRIGFLMSTHYLVGFAFVVDCTFGGSIRYCGNRFQRLNKLLVEADSPEKNETLITRRTKNQFPRYPSVMNEIYRYDSIAIRAADRRWILYVMREARKIHRGLCKTAMELNRAFGIQVLFSMALSFGLMIALLYTTYLTAMASSGHEPFHHKWIYVFNNLMWITFYAMKVLVITNICETTSCEAHRTGGLISKLLDTAASDEDIHDEINMFSLQLIQNPLNFTACGFFSLNYAMVRAMSGAVTTYLIIMIQMRNIYEPENVNFQENFTMLVETNNTD